MNQKGAGRGAALTATPGSGSNGAGLGKGGKNLIHPNPTGRRPNRPRECWHCKQNPADHFGENCALHPSRVAGLENAPETLMGLLKGENFGKAVIEVSEDPTA